jgi:ATP-dependent helicase HrpB
MQIGEGLPIFEVIPAVKQNLEKSNTLILEAPPGAGKSTVLPLHLLKELWLGDKKIIMLEPRRLAAKSVATRMAAILNESVGMTVGYRVRFDTKVSKATRLEVVTEGILTRIIQHDNTLDEYGLVIFDEFHERSVHSDLSLALSREIQQLLREDLRVLIMSATIEGDALALLLGNPPLVRSKGRQYPVELIYNKPDDSKSLAFNVTGIIQKAFREQDGDILVFLPGSADILKVNELLSEKALNASVFPLYGDLPYAQQQEAITPLQGRRKIVLSTSIAETSLTIEGIKVVIDSGFSRVSRFNPRTGLSRLETVQVTKDSADQRAGRAGRLGPGVCYRMWSEGAHMHLVPYRTPEICEADLTPLMLDLANWGVKEFRSLSWLSLPPESNISLARDLLSKIDAVKEGTITNAGKQLLDFPAHPRVGHLLLEGRNAGLGSLAADLAAILDERDFLPRDRGVNIADRVDILRKYRNKEYVTGEKNVLERVAKVSGEWARILGVKMENSVFSPYDAGKLLSLAYPERVARKQSGSQNRYRLENGRAVILPETDDLSREEFLAVAQMDAGMSEGKVFLAAPLLAEDIDHLATEKELVEWDFRKGLLVSVKERRVGAIVLESKPFNSASDELRLAALCNALRKEGLKIFSPDETVSRWIARVESLRKWRTDEKWPDLSESSLLQTAEEWLFPYVNQFKKKEDFQKADLKNILLGIVPWDLAGRIDDLAPEKIKVPSGSLINVEYNTEGNLPVVSVRLQEMFGLLETPAVNEGKVKVLLHLLSPGYKPVQVTQDLRSFWQNTYPEVRKELRVRYSKHSWPEDPWTAEAVRGVKRRNG